LNFRPALNEVVALGGSCKRIPVSLEIFADMQTPIRLLTKIEQRSSHCFLLESAEGGEKWGRYSFLSYDPQMTLTVKNGRTHIVGKDGEKIVDGNPIEAIRSLLEEYAAPTFDYLPRFTGGAVGFFGYDMVRYYESLPDKTVNDGDYPDCCLMISDKIIAFDNMRQRMTIIVNMLTAGDIIRNYIEAVAQIKQIYSLIMDDTPTPVLQKNAEKPQWKSNVTKDEYERMVEAAKEHIRDGDIFQVVLSQRFTARLDGSLLNTYRVLRLTNPSPYMYYLKLGGIELAGASPETLLRLENGTLETCPIAGSRPRGRTEEEDKSLAAELEKDEKELAEHNMLVDLARNDLGRVARFGSVRVAEYCKLARFSHVMHLTSLVTAELADGHDALDALTSIQPAGTLSGAPKVKAMEIIESCESLRRGPYGGAVGYIGFDGNMDVCITIRTIVKKDDVAFVQAGAGIVADSVPELEYYESVNKAKAVLVAAEQAGGII
jgi:anthranilate synthase component 1